MDDYFSFGIPANKIGPRFQIGDGNTSLTITTVCHSCRDGRSVLVECTASNAHGHVHSSGYLYVLREWHSYVSTKNKKPLQF